MKATNNNHNSQPEAFETEGTRRVTGVEKASGQTQLEKAPDPEVSAEPQRRKFSQAYKLRVLDLWDKCTRSGDKSALLRREGLYSQTVNTWLRQRQTGLLVATTKPVNTENMSRADKQKLIRLELENERLKAKLAQAEMILDLQKKIASLMATPQRQEDDRK